MEENTNNEFEVADQTPDPAVIKPFKTAFKWGLITFAAIAIMGGIADLMGMARESWMLSVLKIILFVVGSIMGLREHRDKELGGFVRFGRAFATVLLIGTICSFFLGVLTYIDVATMTEAEIEEVLAYTEKMYTETFGMEGDRLDEAMQAAEESTGNPTPAAFGKFISVTLFALVVGLITGAAMKRDYKY